MCAKIIIILLPKEDPHTIYTYIGAATHHTVNDVWTMSNNGHMGSA